MHLKFHYSNPSFFCSCLILFLLSFYSLSVDTIVAGARLAAWVQKTNAAVNSNQRYYVEGATLTSVVRRRGEGEGDGSRVKGSTNYIQGELEPGRGWS